MDAWANAKYGRYMAKRYELVTEAKAVPCMDCRVAYPPHVMDLDHRPDEVKSFNLGRFSEHGYEAIRAEILKCDVVCANCHRQRTHARRRAT